MNHCCTPEINLTLYIDYTSIIIRRKKTPKKKDISNTHPPTPIPGRKTLPCQVVPRFPSSSPFPVQHALHPASYLYG